MAPPVYLLYVYDWWRTVEREKNIITDMIKIPEFWSEY
jgi:hypothetical protein